MFEFGAQSKWIWLPEREKYGDDKAVLAFFRKEFYLDAARLSEKKRECRIRISADSRYKLYVNGRFAEYGPAKGDDKVRYYDTVNIGPFLTEGWNVIAVEVLRYPAGHNTGNQSVFRAENPGLYLEELTEAAKEPMLQTWQDLNRDAKQIADGGRLGITADDSYVCRLAEDFEIVPEAAGFAPLQIMEQRTGEAQMQGWKLSGYDASGWQAARIYNAFDMNRAVVPGNLEARPIPFMYREKKTFSGVKEIRASASGREAWEALICAGRAVTVPPFSKEIVEFDAGAEECGFLSLKMAGGAGAQVTILCAEAYATDVHIMPDGQRITTKTDRCDSVHGELAGFSDVYRVGGFGSADAPEIYEPFWFRTFRFVRLAVETGEQALTVEGFDFEETGYPLVVRSQVETSDASMADIWEISLRTLQRCMHETYVDCPFYEQLQYAMDARSEILYTYSISMDDRLARSCMESFRRSQRYDGLLNCSSPNCEPNVIPGFSIYYILMLYDHMMYFGDRDFLKRHLGCVDGILNYFDGKLEERGLVGTVGGVLMEHRYWSFIDWTKQWNETTGVPTAVKRGPVTMESLLYLLGLMAGEKILDYVGRTSTAQEYRSRAEAVKTAIQTYCMDEDGLVMDGPGVREYSQHGQVFAILTGLVPKEQGREMLRKTLEDTETFAQCSVAMAYYLFRALEETGLYEYADAKWDIWRQMKAMNLTTCVEDGVNGRSDCHAWGALALYELPSVVLGVRPAAPGYEKIRIAPQTGRLDAASGDVVTKKGIVHVEWSRNDNGGIELDCQTPPGVTIVK